MKKKILLIGTGGTIACTQTENGLAPAESGDVLLSYIPHASEICHVDFCQLMNIDSTNMQPEHWIKIAGKIQACYDDYDGFIITHGTDTMAYTAAALSYMIQNPDKPIVLTGAQKPMSDLITDAKKNLLDSLHFASQDQSCGVFIVFDGKVILGTRARKIRTKSYSAFDSINYPIVAFIDDDKILRYFDQSWDDTPVTFYPNLVPRVFLLKLFPGMEPEILDYIGQHYDAIVIESYGVGGVPFGSKRDFLMALERLTSQNKIVVLASQVMLEGSDAEIYEVGYHAINELNVLQLYDMTVESALVKLMWILSQTRDFKEAKRLFFTPVNHDIISEN